MARAMKHLERKAMEAYAKFADDFDCESCPIAKSFNSWVGWKKELREKTLQGEYWACDICDHFFVARSNYSNKHPCPCRRMGPEKALAMLRRYVKKWRKEGLIK